MLAARREAVRRGVAPLAGAPAGSTRAPRRGVEDILPGFGCTWTATRETALFHRLRASGHFSGSDPRSLYEHLLRQDPRIGVLMHCCGVPAEILGLEDEGMRGARADPAGHGRSWRRRADRGLPTVPGESARALPRGAGGFGMGGPGRDLGSHRSVSMNFGLAVHDPCRSRNDPEVHAAIRTLVRTCGAEVVETEYSHERTRCCGSGGKIENIDPELLCQDRCTRVRPNPSCPW